jgi:uncharacterized membrane protein
MVFVRVVASAALIGVFLGLVGCSGGEPVVSFSAEVKQVLDNNCVSCHVPGQPGYEASGLALDSYDGLMKGTRFGKVVLPGDAQGSVLNMLVEGRADPSIAMPHGANRRLYAEEIQVLRRWVEQGASNN